MIVILSLQFYTLLFLESSSLLDPKKLSFDVFFGDVYTATIAIISLILISGIYRYIYIRIQIKLIYKIGIQVAELIYKLGLSASLLRSLGIDKNEIKVGLNVKIDSFMGEFLLPQVNILLSLITIILVSVALIYINSLAYFFCFTALSVILAMFVIRKKLRINYISKNLSKFRNMINTSIAESIENNDLIEVNGYNSFFAKKFFVENKNLRELQSEAQALAITPKYVIETIIFGGIIALGLVGINVYPNFVDFLPTVIPFVFASQKLLPTFNLIYFSYTQVNATSTIARDIMGLAERSSGYEHDSINTNQIDLQPNIIDVKDITWNRGAQREFETFTGTFRKNKVYQLIGPSGCGKSSFLRVLTKLEKLTSGSIQVDGLQLSQISNASWWNQITYVPQNDVVISASVAENITLKKDINSIEKEQLSFIMDGVGLSEVLVQNSMDLDDHIEPESLFLSGGQVQRFALGRALFNIKPILILDEATSALDIKSEKQVMKFIIDNYSQGRIIFVVSHSASHLDRDIELVEIAC